MTKYLRILLIMIFNGLLMAVVLGQTGTITGKVTNKKSGETLPGTSVILKGTMIAASCDINGMYKLEKVPAGDYTITASFVGFQSVSQSITVNAGKTLTIDFQMGEDLMMLNEMVVVGYGSKKKRDITSSISSVPMEEVKQITVTNFETQLQGKAAGVQVTQDNGMAGGMTSMRIRGTTSLIATSEPLYVIDGVPVIKSSLTTTTGYPDRTSTLNMINPDDIASIEVLKDASAAAIYGARGANGVVLITTKKGKEGKTKWDFTYDAGIAKTTHRLAILNGSEYLQAAKEAWANSNMGTEEEFYKNLPYGIYNTALTYDENKAIIDNTNTNWINTMLRTGFQQKANLSAQGGSQNATYYVGGSYEKVNGIIVGNDFSRLSGKVNLEVRATKKIKIGTNLTFTNRKYVNVPTGWAGGLGTAQSRSLPIMPIHNPDGTYFAPTSGVNMVADYEDRTYLANANNVLGNLYGEYQIIPSLMFRSEWGINDIFQIERKYEGTLTRQEADATDRRLTILSWTTNNTLNYSKLFKEKHDVSAMVGMSYFRNSEQGLELFGQSFPNPSLQNPTSSPNTRKTTSGWQNDYAFISYFARAGYTFNHKYLFTASIRRDGSSRFGPDKKYGNFPAAAIGWVMTEERWLKDIPVLTFLKLRASYGLQGNSEIPEYQYIGTYYITEYNGEAGIGLNRKDNPSLHWEQTAQFDAGLDFGLVDGRVQGEFDYYNKMTKDILVTKNVPSTSGSGSVMDNIGKVRNRGFEFSVTSYNFVNKFKWNTDLNIASNQNKILDLNGQVLSGNDVGNNYGNNYAEEGHPMGAWQLVKWAGVDPETGQDMFINQETGQKTFEYNFARDAVVVGNPYPYLYGGINNTFEYMNFDVSFMFTFSLGNSIYRDDGKFFEGGNLGSNWNQMTTVLSAWKKPGDITDESQLLWNSSVSTYNTTKYLDDGSYLRLKSLTIGYTVPTDVARKLKFDMIRIYFTGVNIWTLTNYPGWDPEVNRDFSGNVTQGVTYLSPPQAKTFNIGVNLNF
jgi:TonB-linked SusC/RagA family outer membrane protein